MKKLLFFFLLIPFFLISATNVVTSKKIVMFPQRYIGQTIKIPEIKFNYLEKNNGHFYLYLHTIEDDELIYPFMQDEKIAFRISEEMAENMQDFLTSERDDREILYVVTIIGKVKKEIVYDNPRYYVDIFQLSFLKNDNSFYKTFRK